MFAELVGNGEKLAVKFDRLQKTGSYSGSYTAQKPGQKNSLDI